MSEAPKMQPIADLIVTATQGLIPHIRVICNDNLMSSIFVSGSFDAPETWAHNIWENSRHFRFHITPKGGKRYFDPADDKVEVELMQGWKCGKFRKSTSPPAKVVERIVAWIKANIQQV